MRAAYSSVSEAQILENLANEKMRMLADAGDLVSDV
jgi:hypothetical protein